MRTTDDIVAGYDPFIRERVLKLSTLIKGFVPGIIELPDESAPVIGYGFGNGYEDLICTIIPSQKGVKLGFYRGTEIADPQRLLKGSGRVHRYMEINDNLKDETIIEYITKACQNYTKRTGKIN